LPPGIYRLTADAASRRLKTALKFALSKALDVILARKLSYASREFQFEERSENL
jgi:hypothetical protein